MHKIHINDFMIAALTATARHKGSALEQNLSTAFGLALASDAGLSGATYIGIVDVDSMAQAFKNKSGNTPQIIATVEEVSATAVQRPKVNDDVIDNVANTFKDLIPKT